MLGTDVGTAVYRHGYVACRHSKVLAYSPWQTVACLVHTHTLTDVFLTVVSMCADATTIVCEHVLKQHCIHVCLGVPIPSVRIRPATWLHFVHEMAVPISQSPQSS